ncbi:ABC transporter ATP-binding protein [Inhella gelatinilytica]|nr:ATP-binding cassette domain-containing protein [Inhella gelatinilytica]
MPDLMAWQDLVWHRPQGPRLGFGSGAIGAGQHLLIQGASGSGKSSFLALLSGLQTPTEGRVQLRGAEWTALTPAARDAWRAQHVGLMPQMLHLVDGLTVWENLALPFWVVDAQVDGACIEATAHRLGLEGLLRRRADQVSGGQRQRVALARALVRRPAVLMLDEPSSSLDDDATARWLGLVHELVQEQGVSVVVATHDARVVQAAKHWPGMNVLRLPVDSAANA